MRHGADRGCTGAVFGEILSGRHALYSLRRRSNLHVPLGRNPERPEDVRVLGDGGVYRDRAGGVVLRLEKGRARLGPGLQHARGNLMALAPPITDLEQLKDHPALARLLAWDSNAVQSARFDRNELTVYVPKAMIREACALLR